MTAPDHAWGAFLLGIALGAAPGPVQLLILSESAKGGLSRGLRVMLGANGTMLAILLAIALGLSAIEPGETALRVLQVIGGGFLIAIGAVWSCGRWPVTTRPNRSRHRWDGRRCAACSWWSLRPGAWIFLATTGSAVIARATVGGGRDAAVATAVALGVGVSCADIIFTVLGSGGKHVIGERGVA